MRDVFVAINLYILTALRLAVFYRPSQLDSWGISARGLERFLALVIGFILLSRFVLCLNYIPSASMEPTLQIHDVFLTNRLAYRLARPRRGEIVTFHEPNGTLVVKRVIGIEGDEVALLGGQLMLNGESVEESYIQPDGRDFLPHRVGAGCVFVLGDNRGRSMDSRAIGDVPESAVVGQVAWRIWPLRRWGLPR